MCSRDPSGDGYTYCAGVTGRPITVWRQLTRTPEISFETDMSGFVMGTSSAPAALSITTSEHVHGSHSLLVTMNTAGGAQIALREPGSIKPGKNMTFFVKLSDNTAWTFIQAFAQDGAGKNYRWTFEGYPANQVLPNEWNSIVVKVPADFSFSGSKVGIAIDPNGSTTTRLYVDAISFDD
jgi:hypothetical protein